MTDNTTINNRLKEWSFEKMNIHKAEQIDWTKYEKIKQIIVTQKPTTTQISPAGDKMLHRFDIEQQPFDLNRNEQEAFQKKFDAENLDIRGVSCSGTTLMVYGYKWQ